jgi:hypothetical protein
MCAAACFFFVGRSDDNFKRSYIETEQGVISTQLIEQKLHIDCDSLNSAVSDFAALGVGVVGAFAPPLAVQSSSLAAEAMGEGLVAEVVSGV